MDKITETPYNAEYKPCSQYQFGETFLVSLFIKNCKLSVKASVYFDQWCLLMQFPVWVISSWFLWLWPHNTKVFVTDSPAIQTVTPISHNYKGNHRSESLEWQYPVCTSFHFFKKKVIRLLGYFTACCYLHYSLLRKKNFTYWCSCRIFHLNQK